MTQQPTPDQDDGDRTVSLEDAAPGDAGLGADIPPDADAPIWAPPGSPHEVPADGLPDRDVPPSANGAGTRVEFHQGGSERIEADEVSIFQGGAAIIRGDKVRVEQGGAFAIIGRRIDLHESGAFIVLARRTTGEMTVAFDWRAIVALTVGLVALILVRRR